MRQSKRDVMMDSKSVNFYRGSKFIGSSVGGWAALRMYENILTGKGFVSSNEREINVFPAASNN